MGDERERDEGGLAGVLVSSLNLFTDAGLARKSLRSKPGRLDRKDIFHKWGSQLCCCFLRSE